MPRIARIILIVTCALVVIFSLLLLNEFRKIIRDYGNLDSQQVAKRCSLLMIFLAIEIITLIIISIYIALIYRTH